MMSGIEQAIEVLKIEAEGILKLVERVDRRFEEMVDAANPVITRKADDDHGDGHDAEADREFLFDFKIVKLLKHAGCLRTSFLF